MISIIVAIAENGAIGKDNQLLWHISDDLKRFKKITAGHKIIMAAIPCCRCLNGRCQIAPASLSPITKPSSLLAARWFFRSKKPFQNVEKTKNVSLSVAPLFTASLCPWPINSTSPAFIDLLRQILSSLKFPKKNGTSPKNQKPSNWRIGVLAIRLKPTIVFVQLEMDWGV